MSNNYFEELTKNSPKENGIYIFAAAQELDMFAIKYCNTHNTVKKTLSQKWFGE